MLTLPLHNNYDQNNDAEGGGETLPPSGAEAHGADRLKFSFLMSLGFQVTSSAIGLAWGFLAARSAISVGGDLRVSASWTPVCSLTWSLMLATLVFRLAVVLRMRNLRSLVRLGMSCAAWTLATMTILADVTFTGYVASAVIYGIFFYSALMILLYMLMEKQMFLESALLFVIATCLIASLIFNPAMGYGRAGLAGVAVAKLEPVIDVSSVVFSC